MPVSLLKKLKVERYRDVLKKIDSLEESVELGENYTNTSESETTVSQDSQQDQNSSETKSKPPKDVLFECVNNSEMLDEHLCSICILVTLHIFNFTIIMLLLITLYLVLVLYY